MHVKKIAWGFGGLAATEIGEEEARGWDLLVKHS